METQFQKRPYQQEQPWFVQDLKSIKVFSNCILQPPPVTDEPTTIPGEVTTVEVPTEPTEPETTVPEDTTVVADTTVPVEATTVGIPTAPSKRRFSIIQLIN